MQVQSGYLQPTSPPAGSSGRPSSRRALTRALELAQEAVRIDATGDDPQGAVYAYAKSVALLNEVMERVMRGEDTESSRRRSSTRRSVVAREDEARRLRSIHDTYYDRMQILVMIYGIPQPQFTNVMSPSSLSGYNGYPTSPPARADLVRPSIESMNDMAQHHEQEHSEDGDDAVEGIGSAMLAGPTSPGEDGRDDDGDYMSHVTPRPVHPAQLAPRTIGIPPMRQPPAGPPPSGPPPSRPRLDSIPRRPSARPGPPGQSPAIPPPPLPTAAPHGTYDLSSPPLETYRQTSYLRDIRHGGEEGEITDDWEELPEDSTERYIALDEDEAIRRGYAPPAPRRRGTSDSEGSLSRRQQPRYQEIPQTLMQHEQYDNQDYGHSHPFAQAETPLQSDEGHPTSSRPPTPANRARGNTQSSTTSSRSGESSAFSDRPRTPPPVPTPPLPHLVSTSTSQGTISQRRKVPNTLSSLGGGGSSASLDAHDHHPPISRSHSPAAIEASSAPQASSRLANSSRPGSTATGLGFGMLTHGRNRAASQPGRRPSQMSLHNATATDYEPVPAIPPVPQTAALPRKASFTTNLAPPPLPGSRHESPSMYGQSLPPISMSPIPPTPGLPTSHASTFAANSSMPPVPLSVLPPLPPVDTMRRPYHLMNLLRASIVTPSGGYLTRKLHVPHDVWTQSGAKLNNLVEKGKCIAVLDQGLEDLTKASNEFLRSARVGVPAGQGISRALGERWIRALDEWIQICDNVIANLGKKLGLGDGITTKKTVGWGSKVTRTLDRMTNGKNLDSPTAYVQNLASLFGASQMLDEHHRLMGAAQGSYAGLPTDVRSQIEARLKRSSEFFVSVVLDFVIRDLGQLLDKYAKKGEKWMEE